MACQDSVVWSNAFDTEPKASIWYSYSAQNNSIEPNVVLEESPELPAGWAAEDGLEFKKLKWSDKELGEHRKGDPHKIKIALRLRPGNNDDAGMDCRAIANGHQNAPGASALLAGERKMKVVNTKPERFSLKMEAPFGEVGFMQKNPTLEPPQEADQTVRLKIDTTSGEQSIRISFTDQRLTAYGGMAVWSHFLHQQRWRHQLAEHLPHDPSSPNAYEPTDVALGFVGGILTGADKLSRVAWLQSDPAIAEVLGIEAVPSQSTFSRFFGVFSQKSSTMLSHLHAAALYCLPTRKEGYTLDLDSWSLLHEDGHQQGVALGYTRLGPKPCHRPLLACVAESRMVANYWLRRGDAHCVNGAADFLRTTLAQKPRHIRFSLLRADTGFAAESVLCAAEEAALPFIVAWRFDQKVQRYCRHDDAHWQKTEIDGLEVQELEQEHIGRRLIVIRQRISERPEAGGKKLLEVPGYRFQSLLTNLPSHLNALVVWRRYNGRGDSENRIRELGEQFGIKRLCCQGFWATEAMHHLAIAAYNLCVLLQRRLGQLEKCELNTLRWRLFSRAAVWSRARGKPTLKLAIQGAAARRWWLEILAKLTAPPNCNAVASLQA